MWPVKLWSPFREKGGKSHSNKGSITDPATYYGVVDLVTLKCFVERKGEISKEKRQLLASGQHDITCSLQWCQ